MQKVEGSSPFTRSRSSRAALRWRRSQVVRQRSAKPPSPVRLRSPPPAKTPANRHLPRRDDSCRSPKVTICADIADLTCSAASASHAASQLGCGGSRHANTGRSPAWLAVQAGRVGGDPTRMARVLYRGARGAVGPACNFGASQLLTGRRRCSTSTSRWGRTFGCKPVTYLALPKFGHAVSISR